MSNKILVSFSAATTADTKSAVEKLIHPMMDWIKITDDQWVVLTNQFTAEKLQNTIDNIAKTKSHGITLVKMTKKKILAPDGYIEAKQDDISERLLTGKC